MRYTTPESKKKLLYISLISLLSFLTIFIRLWYLQIYNHQRFSYMSEKNFSRVTSTPSLRGNIFDCNGNLLVTNQPITNIMWNGSGNQTLSAQQLRALEKLQNILQQHDESFQININKIKFHEKLSTTTLLAQSVPLQALTQIIEQCADSKNLEYPVLSKRYYPHGSLACHTLGYLGDMNMDISGKMGLEKIFEDTLRGKNGSIREVINSFGRKLKREHLQQSESGQNLYTTLDLSLQKIAEKHMPLDQSGACIILDPKTGAIKALVSRPSFDPSIFLSSISSQNWKDLTINNPFLNRAFNACYPPASIFKLVTASAALEQGLITPETTYNCKGFITFKGRRYYCSRRWGHGLLDIKESLAYSCNIMCYEIAKKISIDTLADYAFRFGLGEKTNIIFPEKEGIVPSNDWKMYTQGQRWWKGETLSAAIGQSFLLTTPLQVACMISALFEGYLVKPHILQTHDIETKPLRISQSTRQFLQECMESVITEGTGRNINRLKSVTVYAKTGTAQTSSKQNKKEDYSCHAWFVSYFYYNENNPQPLVMVVLIEKVSGSRAATNIAKKFLIDYIKCKEK